MQQVIIFDGQDVLEQDMQFLEDSKSNEIRRRNRDEAASFGIIADAADSKLRPSVIAPFTLQISAGSAYDGNGDYINIPGLPTAALPTIVFTALDIGKFIVLRYVSVDTDSRAHPVTGVLNDTRRKDSGTYRNPNNTYTIPTDEIGPAYTPGFSLLLLSVNLNTDVRIGFITSVDGGGAATLLLTPSRSTDPGAPRIIYSSYIAGIFNGVIAADPLALFMQHINTFGSLGAAAPLNPHGLIPSDIGAASGTVNLVVHERELHSTGLIGDNRGPVGGLDMVINGASPPNTLTVVNLLPTDLLVVDGNDLSTLSGALTLSFVSEVSNSTFEIFVQSDGFVGQNKIAEFATTPSPIAGVQIAEVILGALATPTTLAFSLNGAVAPKTLSFAGGPPIQITTSGFYKLPSSFSPDTYVIVHTDLTQMATVGVLTPDSVNLFAQTDRELNYVIGTVWWSGSATGFLGYGNGISAGTPRSLKKYGNIQARNVHDDYQAQIDLDMSELRSDGMLYSTDFAFGTPSGSFLPIGKGTAYINGRKETSSSGTGITLPNATAVNQVWFANGSIQFGATLPAVRPQWGVNAAAGGLSDVNGFVFLGTVTTIVAVGITATNTLGRVIIGNLDARLWSRVSGSSGARQIGQEIVGLGNTVHDGLNTLNNTKGGLDSNNTWAFGFTNTFNGLVNFKRTATSPGFAPSWQIEQPDGGESLTWFEGFHTGATPRNLFAFVHQAPDTLILAYRTRKSGLATWELKTTDNLLAARLLLNADGLDFELPVPNAVNAAFPDSGWTRQMGLGGNAASVIHTKVTPDKTVRAWGTVVVASLGTIDAGRTKLVNCTVTHSGANNFIEVTIDGTVVTWADKDGYLVVTNVTIPNNVTGVGYRALDVFKSSSTVFDISRVKADFTGTEQLNTGSDEKIIMFAVFGMDPP